MARKPLDEWVGRATSRVQHHACRVMQGDAFKQRVVTKFEGDIVERNRRDTVPEHTRGDGHASGPAIAQGKGGGDRAPISRVQPVANVRE